MRRTRTIHGRKRHKSPRARAWLCLALLIATSSCVRDGNAPHLAPPLASVPDPESLAASSLALASLVDPAEAAPGSLTAEAAMAANAALPLSSAGDTRAAPLFARGATALDQMRSLDCLAQAIYYEARSETEDGQRAVAQVVLNRMRHPAYPGSVCGVVYQGPMRAGGGCQFTFTCDGSLAITPKGPGWVRARQLAAEALAGSVFAAVGHATHYHTLAVFPQWAPRLTKAALIGSHIFYRFPGQMGTSAAFHQVYAGREPLAVPGRALVRPQLAVQLAGLAPVTGLAQPQRAELASFTYDTLPAVTQTEAGLPESGVREAYRNSGRPRAGLRTPLIDSSPRG